MSSICIIYIRCCNQGATSSPPPKENCWCAKLHTKNFLHICRPLPKIPGIANMGVSYALGYIHDFALFLIFWKKVSDNSHFITLQIDGQSLNLFSSNYITRAKNGHSNTSPKQIMIRSVLHQQRCQPVARRYWIVLVLSSWQNCTGKLRGSLPGN